MARLYLFAEGQTEETFADKVIKPHLADMGVYLQNPMLIAHARKKGKVHRGGGREYLQMKDDIVRRLREDKGTDAYFTTMINQYALHADFPGRDEAEALRHMPERRVASLEQSFSDDIADRRFIPYIQLHEYEAILFSDPNWFEYFYDHHRRQIEELQAIADAHATPELIDDGPHTAPSKRIISQLPNYLKATEGPLVAELIGLQIIRSKCPASISGCRGSKSLTGTNPDGQVRAQQ